MLNDEPIRVLIAEDDYLVSQMLDSLLVESGYEVVGRAEDGCAAIAMTQALRPDVILMDVCMPKMDGIAASARIQELCPTPVIVLTAYDDASLVKQAAEAGVVAFLVKPPRARELRDAIVIATARFADIVELRKMNEALSALNEDLDLFAQTISHDLRHLLSPIRGYAEILYADYDVTPSEEARRDMQIIIQAVHDIDRLIDDLFLLANVRRRTVPIEDISMADVVHDALRRVDYDICKKDARVIVPDDWPVVHGYAPWVVEVWVNYLSNAIKYGGEHPQIELGWEACADEALGRFWIRDHGVGIEEHDLAHVFDIFSRLGDVHLHGHGLGLSIVKRIVEELGGHVAVKSRVDVGSTFSFTLPLAR